MNKAGATVVYSAYILLVLLIFGCAKPPLLKDVTADPSPAGAGKKITFTARIEGAADKVASITGVPQGYEDYTIRLNDEGRDGDEQAGDGVWSYSITIPWDAPAGTFPIDFFAVDKDGDSIPVSGSEEDRFVFKLVVE